jgi:hypothetical protein
MWGPYTTPAYIISKAGWGLPEQSQPLPLCLRCITKINAPFDFAASNQKQRFTFNFIYPISLIALTLLFLKISCNYVLDAVNLAKLD